MKETLFIINPTSGCRAASKTWAEVRRALASRGVAFAEHLTQRPGEATEVTRAAIRAGIRRVIAVGGDGTLNEVVNGYLDGEGQAISPDAAIGLIPSGTGSDFRRSVSLNSTRDALTAIYDSGTRLLDALRVEFQAPDGKPSSRFCINVVSFGLGADAVALVNRWRGRMPRWIGGRVRFLLAAMRALEKHRNSSVRLALDGGREIEARSNLIVVANGRYAGGGMMLAPNASPDDGLLDVIVADRASRLTVLRELGSIRKGGHLNNPKVSQYRARSVSVASEPPLHMEIDGESAGATPARLSVLASRVRFIC